MTQWEIWSYPFPEGLHPAVILSPPEICENADIPEVNVLLGTSAKPATRSPKRHEVVLDANDGLDWRTLIRCHKIYLVSKQALSSPRGKVGFIRRREIGRKLVEVLRLPV